MELRHRYNLQDLLDYLELPRSAFYYHLQQQGKEDKNKAPKEEIWSIYTEHKTYYGYRRVHLEVLNRGWGCNKKVVQRLMRKMELRGKNCRKRSKYNSYKGQIGEIAPNLLDRDFNAEEPNQKWGTDITEFKTRKGKVYLSPIIDFFNQEVVSADTSTRPSYDQVQRMLDPALELLDDGEGASLLFHSDQGWQYQMKEFQETLLAHGITQSMSRKATCLDNAIVENFFSILKREMYYGEEVFDSPEELIIAIEEYIHYYNHYRIKEGLGGMSPVDYRLAHLGKG